MSIARNLLGCCFLPQASRAQASGPGDDNAHVVRRAEFQRTGPAVGFDDRGVAATTEFLPEIAGGQASG